MKLHCMTVAPAWAMSTVYRQCSAAPTRHLCPLQATAALAKGALLKVIIFQQVSGAHDVPRQTDMLVPPYNTLSLAAR